MQSRATHPLAIVVLILSLFSLGCASSSKTSSAGGSSTAVTASSIPTGVASLFNSLGGAQGVQALASAFGVNLAANPAVAKFLDGSAIEAAKTGLYNSIAKAGGQTVASDATDLLGALSGKGLDAAAVAGVGQALSGAATSQALKPEQLAALTSLWEPISKSLLAGQ